MRNVTWATTIRKSARQGEASSSRPCAVVGRKPLVCGSTIDVRAKSNVEGAAVDADLDIPTSTFQLMVAP